jgi:hypothetical protein
MPNLEALMRRLLMPLLVTLLIPFLSAPAAAVALPGGRANFVVAIGSLSSGSARDNWVRLGNYRFSTDGSVRARTYLWWRDVLNECTGDVERGTMSNHVEPSGLERSCGESSSTGGSTSVSGLR